MSRHWRYFPHIRFRFRLPARHTLQFLGLLLTTNIYSAQSKHSVEEFDTLACVLACTGAWSVRGGGWVLTCTGARSVRGRGGGRLENNQGSAPMPKTLPFIYHFWRKR